MAIPSSTISTLSSASSAAQSLSPNTNNSNSFITNLNNAALNTLNVGQPTDPTATLESQNAGFPILRYPLDGGQYFLALVINNYVRPSMLQSLSLTGKSIIALPVPNELIDSQSITYTPQQLAAAVGVATDDIARSMYGSAGQGAPGQTVGGMAGLLQQSIGVGARAGKSIANIAGRLGDAAAQLLGMAPNPYLTVQFLSPNFSSHMMNWTFAPNDPAESQQLNLIINTLKKHSLPTLNQATGGLFFNYPDIIKPILYPNSDLLYQFKYCVLENVLVNWTAGGVPSFHSGTKHPAVVQLQLKFLEIELWTADDPWFDGKAI